MLKQVLKFFVFVGVLCTVAAIDSLIFHYFQSPAIALGLAFSALLWDALTKVFDKGL